MFSVSQVLDPSLVPTNNKQMYLGTIKTNQCNELDESLIKPAQQHQTSVCTSQLVEFLWLETKSDNQTENKRDTINMKVNQKCSSVNIYLCVEKGFTDLDPFCVILN